MTAAELEPELRTIVPACRLVSDRMLRRILHALIDSDRPVVVNTRLPWWVNRGDLVEVEDLDPKILAGGEDQVLFLVEQEERTAYSRFLLHAVVYRRVADAIAAGKLTRQSVEGFFRQAQWDYEPDARFVLSSDHFIPTDADWATFFPRFVATAWVWIETEPGELARVFPSASSPAAAREVLEKLFNTSGLPVTAPLLPMQNSVEASPVADRPGLAARAERAARTGNHVRAAICWHAAGHLEKAAAAIRTGLMGLLAPALKLDDTTSDKWAEAFLPLLGPAGQGPWPHAAKAMYDLQTLGLELSGELFAVDPIRWAKSFGKQSMKLPLVRALPVLRHRALASARRQIGKAQLPTEISEPLLRLIDQSLHVAETEARADYTPRVAAALDAVNLVPANVVERIAREKLTNELAERACDRGFLRFGDLRDAIARNNLKMPDLRGFGEFLTGDQLLKADKLLAESLAGVYHGGEVYLRGIQRASSLSFGTIPGRLFSKYVALPFGGAFLTLEFTQHMVHAGHGAYKFASKILAPKPVPVAAAPMPAPDIPEPVEEPNDDWQIDDFVQVDRTEAVSVAKEVFTSSDNGPHLVTWPVLLGLGFFLMALLYWPAFRNLIGRGLKLLWSGIRYLFHDLPLAVWRSEPIRKIRRHPVTHWVNRWLGSGILVATLVAVVLGFFGASPGRIARGAGFWFVIVTLTRLLPVGRMLEDRVATTLSDAWKMLRVNFLLGILGWIVWVFRELAARVERTLYAVDEWFRFREGQSKPSIRLKMVLGCIWFPIAYVVRFAFNLLIEPQVNPVKHFPVVTVSHKVLFTSLIPVSDATGIPEATLGVLFTGVPGIFGFLAWELRENWRLYEANRPKRLEPIRLGHHGETMRGLLRPGFHSGTVPKKFKAIRKQLAHPLEERNGYAITKAENELHHLAHAIGRFVEREFLPLLRSAKAWQGMEPEAGQVHLTTTSAVVEVLSGNEPLKVIFYLKDGAIAAHVDSTSLSSVGPQRVETLNAAVRGLIALGAAKPDTNLGPEFTWNEWVAFWEKQAR